MGVRSGMSGRPRRPCSPSGPAVALGWTGCRIGEAAALRVGRLDLLARRVEVVEAAAEVNGRLAWGPTKTGERRTVPLPHFLAEQLGAHLADRPHGPDDLVFTRPGGGPLRASKRGERYFRPAVAAAGLPKASASMTSAHCGIPGDPGERLGEDCPGDAWSPLGDPDA